MSSIYAVFKIDEKISLDYIEELIIGIMLVPVVFAFDDADAYYRIVDFAEGLVEPLEFAAVGQSFYVDDFERLVQDVEASFIRIRSKRISHGGLRSCCIHGTAGLWVCS